MRWEIPVMMMRGGSLREYGLCKKTAKRHRREGESEVTVTSTPDHFRCVEHLSSSCSKSHTPTQLQVTCRERDRWLLFDYYLGEVIVTERNVGLY